MVKGYVFKQNHQAKIKILWGTMLSNCEGETILREMSERAHKNGFGAKHDMLADEMTRQRQIAETACAEVRRLANELYDLHSVAAGMGTRMEQIEALFQNK